MVPDVCEVVCGGVKAPGHDPVLGRFLQVDVLRLDHPGPQGVERQKYPVKVIGVLSRYRDHHVAGIVLLFSHLDLLDLELASHVHDLVKSLGERQ